MPCPKGAPHAATTSGASSSSKTVAIGRICSIEKECRRALLTHWALPQIERRVSVQPFGAVQIDNQGRGPLWVKMRKSHVEHNKSAVPPIAEVVEAFSHFQSGPIVLQTIFATEMRNINSRMRRSTQQQFKTAVSRIRLLRAHSAVKSFATQSATSRHQSSPEAQISRASRPTKVYLPNLNYAPFSA